MIKAVFFDFDGVLTRDKTGSLTTLRYLSEQTGVDYERIRGAFKKHNAGLVTGKTTHEGIWPSLCRELNCAIDPALLHKAFESTPMNDAMLRLASKLGEHLSVGIITDNKKDRIDHLKRYASLASLFDPIVVSAEVGSGKGSARIFEYALAYLSVAAAESVFIDNTPDNLVVPDAWAPSTSMTSRTIFRGWWQRWKRGLASVLPLTPNHSIERTYQRPLRALWRAAHVKR